LRRPRARRFERRRGPHHGDVVEAPPDDLEPDREPGLREPAWTVAAGWPVMLKMNVKALPASRPTRTPPISVA